MTPVSELLAGILHGLNQAGIPYVVMRNYDNYPLMVTGDVDLVVRPGDGTRAREEILRAGHSLGWRAFSERSRGYLTYLGLCKPVYPERSVLVLETFAGGHWYCFPYLAAGRILARRRQYSDFWIPSACHEASLTLFHHLLWNRRVPAKYRSRIRELVGQDEPGFREVAATAFGRRCADRVLQCILAADWSQLENDAVELRLTLIRTSLLRQPREAMRMSLGTLSSFRRADEGLAIGLWSLGEDWSRLVARELLALADEWHLFHPGNRRILALDARIGSRATVAAVRRAVRRGGFVVVVASASKGAGLARPTVSCLEYWIELLSDGIVWKNGKRNFQRSEVPHQPRVAATLVLETVLTAKAGCRPTDWQPSE